MSGHLVPPILAEELRSQAPLVRGGSYFCCRLKKQVKTEVPKLDKLGRKTRYTKTVLTEVDCGRRVRINQPSRMMRHMRTEHGYA